MMEARYLAVIQALARHALYAVAELPLDHPQRRIVRHQVERLIKQIADDGDTKQEARLEAKLRSLAKWFDDGAIPSGDIAVLSVVQ